MHADPQPDRLERVARVRSSYSRCRVHEDFIPRFYRRLWQREPDVGRRFAHTDMERQHQVMREAINSLLMYARGSKIAELALDRLARVHSRSDRDVPPHLHRAFVDALVEVVEEVDADADDELLTSWRDVLAPGLERIEAGY
ncbi:MAG: globin [Myxococcales bacterium]|nr:globin [Myxococcales bacterium]MCB9716186.1 globin [Myxococcales bacterium]